MKYEVLDFSGSPLKYEIDGNKISVMYEDSFKGYGSHTADMVVRVTEPGSIGTLLATSVVMNRPSPPGAYYITFKTGTNPNAVFSGSGIVGSGNDTNGRIIAAERSFSAFSAATEPRLVSIKWEDYTGLGHFGHVVRLHSPPGIVMPDMRYTHITRVSNLDYTMISGVAEYKRANYSEYSVIEVRKEKLLPNQVYQIAMAGVWQPELNYYVLPYE